MNHRKKLDHYSRSLDTKYPRKLRTQVFSSFPSLFLLSFLFSVSSDQGQLIRTRRKGKKYNKKNLERWRKGGHLWRNFFVLVILIWCCSSFSVKGLKSSFSSFEQRHHYHHRGEDDDELLSRLTWLEILNDFILFFLLTQVRVPHLKSTVDRTRIIPHLHRLENEMFLFFFLILKCIHFELSLQKLHRWVQDSFNQIAVFFFLVASFVNDSPRCLSMSLKKKREKISRRRVKSKRLKNVVSREGSFIERTLTVLA